MWIKVKGSIDSFEFKNLSLDSMRDGNLFFPVKAETRKAIRKQAGDHVRLVLLQDHSVFKIPLDIVDCLKLEDGVFEKFVALKPSRQKECIDWINAAKLDETKAVRINATINKIQKGGRLHVSTM